ARLMQRLARLSSGDEHDQAQGRADVAGRPAPEAGVATDWATGVSWWALQLLAAPEPPDASSPTFRAFESACRGPGPLGSSAAGRGGGVAWALGAGVGEPGARHLWGAAMARCAAPVDELALAVSKLDLSLVADAPWGTTTLARAQSEGFQPLNRLTDQKG